MEDRTIKEIQESRNTLNQKINTAVKLFEKNNNLTVKHITTTNFGVNESTQFEADIQNPF